MITHYLKTHASVSRSMLGLSLCLHGLFLVAVVCVYPSFIHSRKPVEITVSRVRLVEPKIGSSAAERLHPEPTRADISRPPREMTQSHVAARGVEPTVETVRPKVVTEAPQESIPRKKRSRPLERVEPTTTKKPREPKEKQMKPKEDPQMLLENRLAAIRDQVEKKKADTPSASTSGRAANPPTSAGTTAGGNVSAADEELMRWMDTVRNRINSRWSLLGDQRDLRRVTIVGVRIADDGTLTDAAVDKSSGDEVFDQSAMRAVFQSSPFPTVPPHVRELIRREGGLALRFTPSGIQ